MNNKQYYIYMTTNRARRPIYTGVTNDLIRRIWEHKKKFIPNSFTSQYNCTRLVWYQIAEDPEVAIVREKQLKKWRREKKIFLIEQMNPVWDDLYEGLVED